MPRVLAIFFYLTLFPAFFLMGKQGESMLAIDRAPAKINFDGVCKEQLWDLVTPLKTKMFRPNHGQESSEISEIFVTYDESYLYLAGRLHYSNKSNVIATTKKRDAGAFGNDYFGIMLDTFNDNESALCFETSPTGLRSDFAIANDAQVIERQMPFNRSWNTFWDVETTMDGNVWHVEMRIPFSSLRFQEQNGEVIMGMTIWRVIADKQEFAIYPLVTNNFGTLGIWKPSQAQKVVFTGVTRAIPLYITPYALVGVEQISEMTEDESSYERKTDYTLNAGLDLKYPVSSNMTLDLTFNTDFAQVEVDDQMVNLTRFSLFFPEKRQFFLERASLFTVNTGYMDQLFYSRRIGLYEGEIIPIWAGARLVGRAGKWDVGIMNMQTGKADYIDEDTDSLETILSTNHGVYRLRKQVFNPRSYLGGMITSQIDVDGNYNINTALDGIVNPFGDDYFSFNYVQTFDSDVDYQNNFFDHGKFYLNWEDRSNVGFNYNVILSRAGRYYNPEMGFELMEDYSRAFMMLGYGWVYNQESKKLLDQQITSWIWINKQNMDFKTDIRKISAGYRFSTKNGFRGSIELIDSYEFLKDTFELSDDVYFPNGEYTYTNMTASINTPSNKMLSLRAMAEIGTYYDGTIINLGPAQIFFRPSSSVNLGLDYQYSVITTTPSRNQKFISHLVRLRTDLTFTTKLSISAFFQYSSNDKFGVNNIRFRYNPREGNDLYIVYNGEYNTHLTREIPNLPFSEISNLIVKYTYTFTVQSGRSKQKQHVINYRHN